MQKVAVVDLKENLAVISFFSEGWKESNVDVSLEIRGDFLDLESGTAKKVKEEIDKQSPSGSAIILLIPRQYGQLTSLKIPAKNLETLKTMMEFEVIKHFPIPIEQLYYSYFVTGKKEGMYELNLAGLKLAEFNRWFNVATDAGIRPEVISISSSAWLPPSKEDNFAEKRTFLDLSPNGFEMNIIDGSKILYSRYKKYGNDISKNLFFNSSIGVDSELNALAEEIGNELEHIRLVCEIGELTEYTRNLFVSGGGSAGDELARKLSASSEFITSSVIRLPKGNRASPFSHTSTAIGTFGALSQDNGFNFIPKHLRSSYIEPVKKRLKGLALVAVALLLVWGSAEWGIKSQRMLSLQNELEELKSKASKTEKMLLEVEQMQSTFSSFTAFINSPSLRLATLSAITTALPANTYITDFEVRRGEVIISGISSSATPLVALLEKSKNFKQVRLIGPVKTINGTERFRIGAKQE